MSAELPLKAALRALEPAACPDDQKIMHRQDGVLSVDEAAALSAAISLRRIADAFDGTALGVDISESLAGLAHALIYRRGQ